MPLLDPHPELTAPWPPPRVPLKEAFLFWLKLGFISFGGPAGQIAIMHRELVEKRGWINERQFLHALNFCMLLPGPEAQQLAIYLGWSMHRTWGGIIAGTLFVLPSLVLMIALSAIYCVFGAKSFMIGALGGIKPVVLALIIQAVLRLGTKILRNGFLWAISGGAFAAIALFQVPYPLILAGALLAGYTRFRFAPKSEIAPSTDSSHSLPPPEPYPAPWTRAFKVLGIGVTLWAASMLLIIMRYGWDATLTHMAWFFTKAAWVTFGGAYAVLPYVFQATVSHYGWISGPQMIDGLTLGETTPGPLIIFVAFVGFVSGYSQALLGPNDLFLAGTLASIVVTWFTFLPSFILVLIGAPLITSTHQHTHLEALLPAVAAASIGFILHLSVFFARQVIWPSYPFLGSIHWMALGLTVAAFLALTRLKMNVMVVIALGAAWGLMLQIL